MIEVFEGRLGGGKTYTAVCRMVDAWVAGATVCTNVAVKWLNVKKYCLDLYGLALDDRQYIAIPDEQISEFHRYTPSNSLVVLDEVHLWFNSRDWAQSSRELLAFLTQSRKYNTDIIFISQAAANIDKQFMRLIQYVWRFRDMSKFIIPGLFVRWPFNQIMQVRLDYDGRTVYERRFVFKSKRIFDLYDTNAVYKTAFKRLELDARGQPVKVKKGGLKMFRLTVIGLCVVAAVVLAVKSCSNASRFGVLPSAHGAGLLGHPAAVGGTAQGSPATAAVTPANIVTATATAGRQGCAVGSAWVGLNGRVGSCVLVGVSSDSTLWRSSSGAVVVVALGEAVPR